jgi:hypothetical protein
MVFLCSGSNIWDNRMSFVRFFWNQLWLSFGVNTEINILRLVESQLKVFCEILFRKNKFAEHAFFQLIFVVEVFPKKKVNMLRRDFLLLQDEHIIVFCVFTFRVDWNVFFCRKWKVRLSRRRLNDLCFVQDKHYDLSVLFWLCFLILTMICFCFFLMEGMTGAGWCCRSGTLSTLFGNAP